MNETHYEAVKEGTIWYSIEWSGATGNIAGFIDVSGELLEAY